MPKRDPNTTITGRCLRAGLGPKRTTAVLTFVMLWQMYRSVHNEDPASNSALAREIERDQATVNRWSVDFRTVFAPEGWETPGPLLDAMHVTRNKTVTPRVVGNWRVAT
jgi:hypothetical protein